MAKLIVIDTNVWISGFFWKGIPHRIVNLVYTRDLIPVFTSETWRELSFTTGTIAEKLDLTLIASGLLKRIRKNSHLVHPRTHLCLCRDPKDNILLDAALAAKSTYLITGDQDLLVLGKLEQTTMISPSSYITLHL